MIYTYKYYTLNFNILMIRLIYMYKKANTKNLGVCAKKEHDTLF